MPFNPFTVFIFIATSLALIQLGSSGVIREDTADNPSPHWAFQRIERPTILPAESGNPIDVMLTSKWPARGLSAVGAADDDVLLRRLFLDLTGLPPSPRDRREFLDASSPDRVTKVIQKLLASPRYSEHWARHWMDIWRYTDWYGLDAQLRYSQKHIWHWRDWIVESIAEDKGYDRMVLEMLAADELEPGNLDVERATGFLARNYFLFNRTTWLDGTIEHTSKAFLGLTVNCAKCHDHKYDPITQKDYYRMRAIFEPHQVRLDAYPGELDFERNGIAKAFDDHPDAPTYLHIRGNEATPDTSEIIAPNIPQVLGSLEITPVALPADAWAPGTREDVQRAQLNAALARGAADYAAMEARIAADSARFRQGADETTCVALSKKAAELEWKAELERLDKEAAQAEASLGDGRTKEAKMAASDARAKWTTLKDRGPAEQHSALFGSKKALETPEHNFDTYGPTYPRESTGRRLALAKWIASRDNPLAARVAVNHMWLRTMGQPLVDDVADFGLRAKAPVQQDILDFLAVELIENDWSLKHVLQLITTSQAYQRSSSILAATQENLAVDHANAYYWRSNGKRMTSQMMRDSVLASADRLDFQMGGAPVSIWNTSDRRSLYFRHSRDDLHRFHASFDDANILECYRREESIAPQQALALMNDKHVYEVSNRLAVQSLSTHANRTNFLNDIFQQVLGRSPNADETAACLKTLGAIATDVSSEPSARTTVILALFNHNDFVTIR